MKIAIVHDWLTGMRGGEKCLEEIIKLYPEADIFTLIADKEKLSPLLQNQNIKTSFFQYLPGVKKYYRFLLPLFPLAARDISRKLSDYNLIISVSHCFAKNITPPEGAKHICYCLTPVRYIWDQYDMYFKGTRIEPIVRIFRNYLKKWDKNSAKNVHQFAAISEFIKKRIDDYYQRDSEVIYPPVDSSWIGNVKEEGKSEGFLVVNALVPYKNTHLVTEAFNELNLPLTIVGAGPELNRINKLKNQNIKILSNVSSKELAALYKKSRAIVFAAEEDFGITPVENQAAGKPVIAYGAGGALETVIDVTRDDRGSGLFFKELSKDSIVEAVRTFIKREDEFESKSCIESSKRFSDNIFRDKFSVFVDRSLQ